MTRQMITISEPRLRSLGVPIYLIWLIRRLSVLANRPMLKGDPGPAGMPAVQLTQAEYDALPNPDPDTAYLITDGVPLVVEYVLTQVEFDALSVVDPMATYYIVAEVL